MALSVISFIALFSLPLLTCAVPLTVSKITQIIIIRRKKRAESLLASYLMCFCALFYGRDAILFCVSTKLFLKINARNDLLSSFLYR